MDFAELADYQAYRKLLDAESAWHAQIGTFKEQLLRVLKSPTAPKVHQQLATEIVDWIEERVKFLMSLGNEEGFARHWVAELEAKFVWRGAATLGDPKGAWHDQATPPLSQRDLTAPGCQWREYLEQEYRLKGLASPVEVA